MAFDARPWLGLGCAHLALAAILGVVAAAPSALYPQATHYLLALGGVLLVAASLAYALVSPLTGRELLGDTAAQAVLGLVLAGSALALALAPLHDDSIRAVTLLYGAAFVVLPLHLLATAVSGKPWREGAATYTQDQPFRVGDLAAVSCLGAALVALAGAGALFLIFPRHVVSPGVAVFVLGFALPFFAGLLAFLLPRHAKAPLSGATLLYGALAVGALSAATLAISFLFPDGASFRFPAAGALLAILLAGAAFVRARFPHPPDAPARAALPLLRGSGALGVLAGVALVLALYRDRIDPLFVPATYAMLALVVALAAACVLLAAPLVLRRDPPWSRWPLWASVVGIAGLFVLSPAFEYDRSPFPGAVVLAVAMLIAASGLARLAMSES